MRPGPDQLSGSFTGFSGIQHWAEVSNGEFGVAVATRDVPAIEFGEIRTNDWSLHYEPRRSAFFFYVMNNRWNTNQALWEGSDLWRYGYLELKFALTSYKGDWRKGKAVRFGWEHNTPLASRVIDRAQAGTLPSGALSFCDGLPENVILQSFKRAEDGDGYVARFYETEGREAVVRWFGVPRRPRQAEMTDLVERRLSPVALDDGKIVFRIAAYQLATIRVRY